MSLKQNFSKLQFARFSTKVNADNLRYSNTILLPKTKLPLRLENKKLVQRDKSLSNVSTSQ